MSKDANSTELFLQYLDLLFILQTYNCNLDVTTLFPNLSEGLYLIASTDELAALHPTDRSMVLSKCIYFLALNIPIGDDDFYKQLAASKEDCFKIISEERDIDRKIHLLKCAKNEDHMLGKLFWTPRGANPTSLQKGVLKRIVAALTKLDAAIELPTLPAATRRPSG